MPTTENCSKGPNEHIQNFRQHTVPMSSQKGSKWRPALRKIKDGIFSRKDCSRPDTSSPGAPLPLSETNQQRFDQRILLSTRAGDSRDSFHSSFRESSRTAVSSKCSEFSLELKDSNGYNFFRRRLSTPTRKAEEAKNKLTQTQHERGHTNIIRPTSSGYVPEYPGKPWEHDPLMHRPATGAYIPQHAASDFKQMSIGRLHLVDTYASQKVHNNWPSFEPDHPVNVPAAAVEPDDSSGDFQEFLAQSRAEESRIRESSRLHSPNKILATQAEKRMTGIEASYCLAVKDRPTTSIPSASRRGSLFEHVAEYIKPSDAGGVRRSMEANRRPVERDQSPLKVKPNPSVNQRTSLSRPLSRTESFLFSVGKYIKPVNQGHLPGAVNKPRTCTNGNLAVGDKQDKQATRWSTMGRTSRRSVSQERNWGGDSRSHPVDSSTSGKHRRSGMPTSPGLDRYNRGIRKGLY
jgi:hypothetical protein